MGILIHKQNTALLEVVPVPFSQPEAEPIEIRVQKALRNAHELIRQSNNLRESVFGMVDRFDEEAAQEGRRMALERNPNRSVSMLGWTVDTALRITNAAKANLQVFDSTSDCLQIVAQHGFSQSFLNFFNSVHAGQAACGQAFGTRSRVIVEDVTESQVFCGTPALEVLLDAGVRAVQSTPLVSSSGTVLGILSTHWPSPGHLSNRSLASLDILTRLVARWLEHTRNPIPCD